MKNWLIGKLGGVSKQTYMDGIDTYGAMLDMYANQFYKLEQENTDITKRNYNLEKENAGMKAEKAEMEEAGKEMSERISELTNKLNEERKVSNGLMAKGTALGIKVSELQDELGRKNKELSETKVQLLDVLRNKPSDPALRSEIARLKGELELLKRNKFKRGRK